MKGTPTTASTCHATNRIVRSPAPPGGTVQSQASPNANHNGVTREEATVGREQDPGREKLERASGEQVKVERQADERTTRALGETAIKGTNRK